MTNQAKTSAPTVCYHCGEDCTDEVFHLDEKVFCCFGCKTVYEILQENELCRYYDLQANPGATQKGKTDAGKYQVLDRPDIAARFITFEDEQQYHVTFYLPHIHCSSCIWLLENLHTLHQGVIHSRVDFRRKEIYLIAAKKEIGLQQLATLLDSVGYEPYLSLQDTEQKVKPGVQRGRLIRLAVAGFCFGNIMLFSAPEYLARGTMNDAALQTLFQYLSLLFSLPVFFYSAQEFYVSSWKSLKKKYLNIDAPIALAIIVTFVRSLYTVFVEGEGGYFDSMSGIVFFMLVGRYFQDRTYSMVTFNRNYKSYFPLSSAVIRNDTEVQIPVTELQSGDHYMIRNNELIPADSILIQGKAHIDYSFVTGESEPVEKGIGDLIYAGGRQKGSLLQLRVIKEVSQSYLTSLWNKAGVEKEEQQPYPYIQLLSKHFSLIVFVLSALACIYWLFVDSSRALDAFITPLIIACPCALLLSATFTNGNAIAWLGRAGLYLKNAGVLEKMTHITAVVFDKTGTIAQSKKADIQFVGEGLTDEQKNWIFSIANESSHPYSRAIAAWAGGIKLPVSHFEELAGKGIEGKVAGQWISILKNSNREVAGSSLFINEIHVGRFEFKASLFKGVDTLMKRLQQKFPVYVLSGDSDADKSAISSFLPAENQHYHCSPGQKMDFIKNLQQQGHKVMMLGDGLNDAGALLVSDVGVAVTADIHSFTPASDVILDARNMATADNLLKYAAYAQKVIITSFIVSILYNIIGLYFALQGLLEPVIAAILMPLSTISIVLLTTGLTSWYARRLVKLR